MKQFLRLFCIFFEINHKFFISLWYFVRCINMVKCPNSYLIHITAIIITTTLSVSVGCKQGQRVNSPLFFIVRLDLGMKRFAVSSDGIVFDDKAYKARRRRLRFLKSNLKAKGTKSAKRKLKRLKRKERGQSKDFMCRMANAIIASSGDATHIVLENLKKIKKNTSKNEQGFKKKRHNNAFSQVALAKFREILTYKAALTGKRVVTVSPKWTSQIDSRTGNRDGKRQGCRYYCSDGIVLDADWNAALNIAIRSKHPTSTALPLDGKLQFLVGRCLSMRHRGVKPASL